MSVSRRTNPDWASACGLRCKVKKIFFILIAYCAGKHVSTPKNCIRKLQDRAKVKRSINDNV